MTSLYTYHQVYLRPEGQGHKHPIIFNIFKKNYAVLNIKDLDVFDDGTVIEIDMLRDIGMVKGRVDGVKLLGDGETTKKFSLKNILVSKTAKEKIESAGGSIEI